MLEGLQTHVPLISWMWHHIWAVHCCLHLEWNLMTHSGMLLIVMQKISCEMIIQLHSHFQVKKWPNGEEYQLNLPCLCHTPQAYNSPHSCYLLPNLGIISPMLTSQDDYDPTPEIDIIDQESSKGNIFVDGFVKLLPGYNHHDRFMAAFRKVICRNDDGFWMYGIKDGDLGSNSAEQGCCGFECAGSTLSSPIMPIFVCHMEYGIWKRALLTFWEGWWSISGLNCKLFELNSINDCCLT